MIEEKADDKKIFYVHGGVEAKNEKKLDLLQRKVTTLLSLRPLGLSVRALILGIFITLFLLVLVNPG